MKREEIIKKDLQEKLSEYRYTHSLNVAKEARKLALKYQVDPDKAYLCGLIHDIAKEFTIDENKSFVEKYNLDKEVLAKDNLKFIHALIGSVIAKDVYSFDEEMTNAVFYHPTGRIKMTDLEKIIYLADKIEPGKNYKGIEEERVLAYQDLDKAIILCLETKLKKLKEEKKKINKSSIATLNYLKNIV